MSFGDEYYGRSQKKNEPLIKSPKRSRNHWKFWSLLLFLIPALTLVIINTYLLYETHQDYILLDKKLKHLQASLEETGSMIKLSVKPQVDIITSFLSYQLPEAILRAFRRSNNELTNRLGGITVNLVNLIDMYKSILGFDEEWMLMPDTKQITCSFIDNSEVGEHFERVRRSRHEYFKDKPKPKLRIPTSDPFLNDLPVNSAEQILEHVFTNHTSLKDETRGVLGAVLETIQKYFGENSTRVTIYEGIRKIFGENWGGQGQRNDSSPSDLMYIQPRPTPTHRPSQSLMRRKRYAASLVRTRRDKGDSPTPDYNYYEGSDIHVHTITNTVPDMCRVTKEIMGFNQLNCDTYDLLIEYLSCLMPAYLE